MYVGSGFQGNCDVDDILFSRRLFVCLVRRLPDEAPLPPVPQLGAMQQPDTATTEVGHTCAGNVSYSKYV
jgi:hypothetical protein